MNTRSLLCVALCGVALNAHADFFVEADLSLVGGAGTRTVNPADSGKEETVYDTGATNASLIEG